MKVDDPLFGLAPATHNKTKTENRHRPPLYGLWPPLRRRPRRRRSSRRLRTISPVETANTPPPPIDFGLFFRFSEVPLSICLGAPVSSFN